MNSATQTVREIALEQPSSMRVFEHYGIDYCCGGRKPLAEACAASKVEVDAVIAALEAAATVAVPEAEDWALQSMEELVTHIVATHHAYVRRELPRLAEFAQKVVNRHGANRVELPAIQTALSTLEEELMLHLAKEETILFPYIVKLERARTSGAAMPSSCFGTVAHPIQMMTQEHDAAGTMLAEMRRLSENFTTPADACPTYHAFYDGLKEFERDLHQHIHLENNILFPRAIEAELHTGESR
ncbi:MAG: iron-sulfur cluster repair di-iron protein [Terracidiphilus sp.]